MSKRREREFNEIINGAITGLPITLVVPRLVIAIRALCDELATHGRDSHRLLIEYLDRPNSEDGE